MKCLGMQMWTWTLCVLLSGICVSQAAPGPHYLVPIPAVLEAGAETTFCASVMEPNETLTITVTLVSAEENITLLTHTSDKDFHVCRQFQVSFQDRPVEVRGNTFHSKEVRKVMIKSYQPITFVQTDKPIYLPGQTGNLQFTCDTLPVGVPNRLCIEDPNNNRIGQWLNETSDSVILQRSYSLNPEAREGQYQIIVKVGDDKIYQSFKVEKYVLPKFDLTLDVKDEISVKQEELKSEVCAKYTFGQPVPGVVKLKACRPLNRYIDLIRVNKCVSVYLFSCCYISLMTQTNKNGCATFTFMMSSFNKLDQKAVQDVLDVTAELEEEGTGIRQVRKITISYVIGTLSFIDTPQIYNKGTNVKAVDYSGKPIPDMPLYLFQGQRWSPTRLQNLTTDSEGLATFSVSTDSFIGDVVLQVSRNNNTPTLEYIGYRVPFYDTKFHSLKMFQPVSEDTKTVSSLKVQKREDTLSCGKEEEIQIAYTVVGEPRGSVDFLYLVNFSSFFVSVNQGTVSFKLEVSPDMAPEIQVVVYAVLPSENVIANSADFNVEKCFGHKVSLEFAPTTSVPGEEVDIQVTAQPDSLCGVSAVDQSVLIKEPGKTLEAEKIFNLLPVKKSTYIPYQAEDPTECLHVRPRRYIMPYPDSQEDPHSVFSNAGLKMVTNLFIRVPSCLKYRGREFHQGHGHYAPVPVGAGLSHYDVVDNAVIETVRTFFPETWIWDLVEVGDSGRKDIPLKVPDTITTWETEAFCLSPRGFGLAPRQKFTVFQPFFLELTMPYSVIRGESFELKATVFNYQSSCMMMSVEPTVSTDYTLTPLSDGVYTSCVCGSERWTVSWTMTPSTLGVVNVTVSAKAVASHILCNNEVVDVPKQGRVDTVTKPLVVKAEGSEVTDTYNWLLLDSVAGDILGRALKNLDGLLQMPYGCGEQNMALLAPNIYILQYLKGTEQLTPAIMEKAKNFLTSGYQRQLNYKHGDGAYSTFGTGAGNTWLTAFVLRSFSKAQSFIYIDPDHIDLSTNWLQAKQRENGCFEKSGKLFNNRMKGGVSDEVTLSAYITAAFLEMNSKADNPVVKNSLGCLKESMSNLSNTYTTALMAYVFSLAGDVETRDRLLQHLDSVAIREGGFLHWSQKATETSASLSVEISSYVLLAKLSGSPSAGDLGYASSIVRWLSRQQNSYGGFSSTQDTVVALQALALYSTLVFSPEGSSTVKVQAPSGPQLFEVNPNNKLLYQESALQDMAGKFSLEVKGSACASIQISVDYNIPTPTLVSTLSVKITTEVDTSKPTRPKLTLKLYSGRESDTNMVILDIKVLSGFLRGALLVDRVDRKEDHVQVYLRELPKDTPINHSLDLIQELQVKDLKPAVVKIYDYYQNKFKTNKKHPLTLLSSLRGSWS
uniref:Alpha-1-macroglobulin-like n=1 Tax=Salarias fasciatus TaxID=181472 RepID=A0A672JDB3_SALFA